MWFLKENFNPQKNWKLDQMSGHTIKLLQAKKNKPLT